MQIIEVKEKADWKRFHQAPHLVYRDDPNWVAPLEVEIAAIFDPAENKVFEHGTAKLWVLLDERNRPAGRIAAFVDFDRAQPGMIAEGGVGFFDCVNNEDYASALFAEAEMFLKSHGVQVVDGPVNFGFRDKYWGLLARGFYPPLYQENYNPPYYEQFFVQNGYQPFEQILTFTGYTKEIPFKRIGAIAERLQKRQPMYVKAFSFKNLDRFSEDFAEIYNASFGHYDHFNPVTKEVVAKMMEQAKPVLDPGLACIAYYEDKPAGFVALYPDINPLIKHAKGKLNWRTIPMFLFKKRFTKTYNAKGMGFGIHPEYKSKGIFSLLINYLSTEHNVTTYPKMCLATIRGHNKAIQSVYEKLGVKPERAHVGYRKAIDPKVEIKPFDFIEFEEPDPSLA